MEPRHSGSRMMEANFESLTSFDAKNRDVTEASILVAVDAIVDAVAAIVSLSMVAQFEIWTKTTTTLTTLFYHLSNVDH